MRSQQMQGWRWGPALAMAALVWAACFGSEPNSGGGAGSNTCSSTDDAGAYQGILFTLDSSGDLTVNFDAGNGGIDLGPTHLGDGGIGHIYEWPCLATADCSTQRDCSITFASPNGVSQWSAVSVNFGNGSDCTASTTTPDAGATADGGGSCCMSCGINMQPCGGACLPLFDQCTSGPGCACP